MLYNYTKEPPKNPILIIKAPTVGAFIIRIGYFGGHFAMEPYASEAETQRSSSGLEPTIRKIWKGLGFGAYRAYRVYRVYRVYRAYRV